MVTLNYKSHGAFLYEDTDRYQELSKISVDSCAHHNVQESKGFWAPFKYNQGDTELPEVKFACYLLKGHVKHCALYSQHREAKIGASGIPDQPELCNEILSQKTQSVCNLKDDHFRPH